MSSTPSNRAATDSEMIDHLFETIGSLTSVASSLLAVTTDLNKRIGAIETKWVELDQEVSELSAELGMTTNLRVLEVEQKVKALASDISSTLGAVSETIKDRHFPKTKSPDPSAH